ncbi:TonB family protein [Vibrio kasasachensis]|uniref:energy transducer TonB n=1 Tax=Vibrio kasasachensis TaxID=2910248 RepID=UPI003D0F33A2
MSLLQQNLSSNNAIRSRWYQQPLLIAVMINLLLVWLMYWLTVGNQTVARVKPVSLSTVFHAHQEENIEPEIEQLFELSQAPKSASMPPPPMVVALSALDFDSSVSIPNIKIPLDRSKPNLQMVSLTFSPEGTGPGSVMSSAMAQAKPVFQIPPQYPFRAKQNGVEGYVTLELNINAEGKAEEIKVVAESPEGVFSRSAKRAVIRWRFIAPKENQWQRITIRYELEK